MAASVPTSKYVQSFNSAFDSLAKIVDKISNAQTISELNSAQREARDALQLVHFRAFDLARWVETEISLRRKALRETTFVEIMDVHSPVEEVPVERDKTVKVATKKKNARRGMKKNAKKATA